MSSIEFEIAQQTDILQNAQRIASEATKKIEELKCMKDDRAIMLLMGMKNANSAPSLVWTPENTRREWLHMTEQSQNAWRNALRTLDAYDAALKIQHDNEEADEA